MLDTMNRRRRLFVHASLATLPGFASPAWSQSAGLKTVGILAPSTRAKEQVILKPFLDEMQRLGYVEGQSVAYDWALGFDQEQILPRIAAELVARRPDVIFAPPAPAAIAAARATQSIPVVFATGTDPVGIGLVRSLGRPGGNVTGVISVAESLAPKLVQMLREIDPKVTVIGYLGNQEDPRWKVDGDALKALSRPLGITMVQAPVANPEQLSGAIDELIRRGAQAVITGSSVTFNLRDELMQLSSRHRIPVVAHRSEMADVGALFSYGAPLHEQIRLSARLVDRVLKGESPGSIPVEQPNRFELVVNQRAAKSLGLTIPGSLLLRADRTIS
jgi:putative tryptophan/tyrosine transport system substrate-binding protein